MANQGLSSSLSVNFFSRSVRSSFPIIPSLLYFLRMCNTFETCCTISFYHFIEQTKTQNHSHLNVPSSMIKKKKKEKSCSFERKFHFSRLWQIQQPKKIFFNVCTRIQISREIHDLRIHAFTTQMITQSFFYKVISVEMNDNLSLSSSPLYAVAECFRGICCARELRSTPSFPQTKYATRFHDSLRFSDVFILLRVSCARVHVYFSSSFLTTILSV